jgi:hypothetical protein
MTDGLSGDDKRVLDELEALQRGIQGARRGQAGPAGPVIRPAPDVATPGPRVDAVSPDRWASTPSQNREAAASDAASHSPGAHPMFGDDEIKAEAAGRWRLPRAIWMPAVAIALIALVWITTGTGDAPPAAVPSSASEEPAPPAAAPVEPPEASPVEPHRLRLDLTTTRNVWLRVTVDGRVALERELGPGEKLPFGADRSIVIRAGDAGAVSVTVGGVDRGPLGEDGKVLTRRFDAEPR